MTRFEKPPWKHVAVVGAALLLVILLVIGIDSYRTDQDKKEFCENHSGTVLYPICERNEFKMCHGKSNATIFLDCGG